MVFPAPGWWWFGYVCLVPLMLVLRTASSARRALLLGWLGGIGFLVGVMSWLIPTLSVAILVLAALLGLLWAPWGWLVWRLLHGTPDGGRAAAALVLVPSGWLLIETVRSWQYLGGPWGLLGASQYAQHFALRLASVGGVWADSLLLVAVNTALVVLVAAWGGAPWPGGAPRHGGLRRVRAAVGARPRATGRGVSVGVVQPGVIATPEARAAREELLTRQLLAAHPDIVLWGESSLSYDLTARRRLAGQLAALSRQAGADLMVGVDAERPGSSGGIYKSSVVVGPDGPTGQVYDKIRLVPFGEYIPLRPALGWIADLSKAAGVDRRRGTAQVVMTLPTRDAGPSASARSSASSPPSPT
ncbi:apolipoprotein N-acyltransferase [Streptacidiphilus monticola]